MHVDLAENSPIFAPEHSVWVLAAHRNSVRLSRKSLTLGKSAVMVLTLVSAYFHNLYLPLGIGSGGVAATGVKSKDIQDRQPIIGADLRICSTVTSIYNVGSYVVFRIDKKQNTVEEVTVIFWALESLTYKQEGD